jgi:hypothetical protein
MYFSYLAGMSPYISLKIKKKILGNFVALFVIGIEIFKFYIITYLQ